MIKTGVSLTPFNSALVGSFAEAFPEKSVNAIQLLVTVPNLLAMVMSVTSGYLVIWLPKKKLLILSLIIYLVLGFAPVFLYGFKILMAIRIGIGVAQGLATPVSAAVISDFFDGQDRAKIMGIQGGSIGAGVLLGSMIGGILANHGYQMGFLPYLYCLLPLIAVVLLLPEQSRSESRDRRAVKLPRSVFFLALFTFVFGLNSSAFDTNISLHIGGRFAGSSTVSGLVCSMYAVAQAATGFALGLLYKKLKQFTLPAIMLASGVGLVTIAFFPSSLAILFFGAALCGGAYCTFIAQSLFEGSALVGPASVALAVSCVDIAKSTGKLISPLVLNTAVEKGTGTLSTFRVFILAGSVILVTALAVFLQKYIKNKRRNRGSPEKGRGRSASDQLSESSVPGP